MTAADRVRTPEGVRPIVFDRHNRRVKIYEIESPDEIRSSTLLADAEAGGFTKVVVYARDGDADDWKELGFVNEGTIRGFFADRADATIWSRFLDDERAVHPRSEEHDQHVEIARSCESSPPVLAEEFTCEIGSEEDAETIASLMEGIFTEYPDAISPEWVTEAIREGTRHFRVVRDSSGEIIASASAEIDKENRSAELTDCATRPAARGKGLMRYILTELQNDMIERGITDLYTLARSDELSMNCAFSKLGWTYEGRLVNNCRMPNGWESMNIWCRA